ncbi:unnamed protein product [Linum tenue]|uniref:HMG box domain-containing protein n=1 Tax=Linum tenue TaxID=586396 RepID=A0AAV0KHY9_9ROSI|nr:unnamed protein product [Linum tenue]CAI0421800.1 unnamed protein product [Linum tenue]
MKGGKSKADGKSTDAALKPRAAGRSKKAVKDPNKPKRPPSAFFVFMEEFRKVFKEKNPNNKSVAADKATYKAKADKRKAEYEKTMDAYNKKQAGGHGDDDSDKSKSEVNDNEDESGEVRPNPTVRFLILDL